MDEAQARDWLSIGLARIEGKRRTWERREDYYRGKQDLPYAPEGVNREYLQLREMAPANWLALAMNTPIQRLRAEGFRTGRDAAADAATWNEVWQPNKLDSRQRVIYSQMVVHGRGLCSVWPSSRTPKTPVIRPENGKRVHLEPDPDDPWTTKWVVKTFTLDEPSPSRIVLPASVAPQTARQVGMVYDATHWFRFERGGNAGGLRTDAWELKGAGEHPMGEPPFVAFDNQQDADGEPSAGITALMPAQDAINTIRFHTLLAMQFSAYRQRVFTGYDPVVRDESGQPVLRRDASGQPILDANGQAMPVVSSPGRIGVDRALVFPGSDTKVFDMPESNLANYIAVLDKFLSDLFAIGQVPPQYLLNKMANISGDGLDAAESTLQSLVSDLQRWTGESLEQVMRLANRARGEDEPDVASEVVWADAEAKSFAQLTDGIVKLIGVGFPRQGGFEMLPGATPQKVQRWMDLAEEQREQEGAADPLVRAADAFRTPPPMPTLDELVDEVDDNDAA